MDVEKRSLGVRVITKNIVMELFVHISNRLYKMDLKAKQIVLENEI